MNEEIKKAWHESKPVFYTFNGTVPEIASYNTMEDLDETYHAGRMHGDYLFLNHQMKRRYMYFEIYNFKTKKRYTRRIPAFD